MHHFILSQLAKRPLRDFAEFQPLAPGAAGWHGGGARRDGLPGRVAGARRADGTRRRGLRGPGRAGADRPAGAGAVAMQLSIEQLDQYNRLGYVVVPCPFPAQLTEECLRAVEKVAVDADANSGDTRKNHFRLEPQIEGSYWSALDHSLPFLKIELHPEIIEIARQLIGAEDIYFRNGGINELAPGRGFLWHRDSGGVYTEFMHYFSGAEEGSGCLRVVPGSHKGQQHFEHARSDRKELVLNRYVDDPAVDGSKVVDIELEAGQFSLHDVYLIHGSNPNTSGKRRAGVSIRYMPATSRLDRKMLETGARSGYFVNWETRPLWLLRGIDRAGNDFEGGHP